MKQQTYLRWMMLAPWLLLAGCAGSGDVPPSPAPMKAEDYLARRLDDPKLLAFIRHASGQDKEVVWNFAALYWASLYYNPALEEAKAFVNVAQGAEVTAGASPNPTINFSPSYDNSTTPSVWLLGLGLNIPIETNGKRELRLEGASKQTESARYQLVGKAWDIRAQLLLALADMDIARETIARTEQLLATQSAMVAEYEKRISQGQMATANASQAQVNYQQTMLQLEQAKTDQQQAIVRLAGAIGVPVEAVKAVNIDAALPAIAMQAAPRENVLKQHPALLSALADYRAAHALLKLEVAKRIPDIDLGPGYEWNSEQGGKFTLGLSFVLPVANDNEGPIQEASAKETLAAKHVEVVQAAIINQMEQAQAAYVSAQREQESARRIVALQDTKAERLNQSFTQKSAAALPLLYARNDQQIAKVAELASYAKLLKAGVAWEDATRQPVFGAVIGAHRLMRETH